MLFDDDSSDEKGSGSYSCHELSDNMEEENQRNDYEDLVFKDPAIGDYVLVKFPGKREPKYYVGLVEGVVECGLHVKCARNIGNLAFRWPEPHDE